MKTEILTFYLGDYLLGIDILKTKEMVRKAIYDKVAKADSYILGLLNLRGQIITLFDLKKVLLIHKENINSLNECSCIILKKAQDVEELVGFEIDRPGEVLEIDTNDISRATANMDIRIKSFVEGIIEIDGKEIILISTKSIFMIDNSILGGI